MASSAHSFSDTKIPSSVLIIGSGVFGLSTAYSLAQDPKFKDTSITVVDRQPFPAPDGSSIDTSRIIRPDYASPPYATLANTAQSLWRTTPGLSNHYHENGLVLTASGSQKAYVTSSLTNVRNLGARDEDISVLHSTEEIAAASGTENGSGVFGYLNRTSGRADAEGAMRWLRSQAESLNRITFTTGTISTLLFSTSPPSVRGARLANGHELTADLTILATGAWTSSLLDMRGILTATGQVLSYLPISPTEQSHLENNATILNLSTGMFMMPPSRLTLKIARHGHGYRNPVTIPNPENPGGENITVSLPVTAVDDPKQEIAPEGKRDCRDFLRTIHPRLAERPFSHTRICWYTDTPTGDFLMSYHPKYAGLFVASGGSGHGFKFLPVIGDEIVKCILGQTPAQWIGRWTWPERRVDESEWEGDGSRGGPKGMVMSEEMRKGRSKL